DQPAAGGAPRLAGAGRQRHRRRPRLPRARHRPPGGAARGGGALPVSRRAASRTVVAAGRAVHRRLVRAFGAGVQRLRLDPLRLRLDHRAAARDAAGGGQLRFAARRAGRRLLAGRVHPPARLRTVLSHVVVTTDVIEKSLAELWRHELRWLRTTRAAEPTGFAFVFITFTFPVLLAGLAL